MSPSFGSPTRGLLDRAGARAASTRFRAAGGDPDQGEAPEGVREATGHAARPRPPPRQRRPCRVIGYSRWERLRALRRGVRGEDADARCRHRCTTWRDARDPRGWTTPNKVIALMRADRPLPRLRHKQAPVRRRKMMRFDCKASKETGEKIVPALVVFTTPAGCGQTITPSVARARAPRLDASSAGRRTVLAGRGRGAARAEVRP